MKGEVKSFRAVPPTISVNVKKWAPVSLCSRPYTAAGTKRIPVWVKISIPRWNNKVLVRIPPIQPHCSSGTESASPQTVAFGRVGTTVLLVSHRRGGYIYWLLGSFSDLWKKLATAPQRFQDFDIMLQSTSPIHRESCQGGTGGDSNRKEPRHREVSRS